MNINEIIVFVTGTIFGLLLLPFIQALADLMWTGVEVFKAKMSVNITKSNVEINKLNSELQECNTQAIGFQAPNGSYDEYYDDEEYDEKFNNRCSKNKIKVGF